MSKTTALRKRARPQRKDVLQRVLHALRRPGFVRAGERVGVAVSGGADSIALLLLLLELREKLGLVLSVAHFNHKLRGKASDADEKFVARLAANHGLEFHAAHTDVAAMAKRERTNLEDAARRARYAFFWRLVGEGRVAHVAVAHTMDDQAETVLAHILRGTGLAGLAGIHPIAGPVIRPLLGVRRAELRAYLRSRRQAWREDVSNLDTTRMRARIRKHLIPFLEKKFQPAAVAHLATLAGLAREDEAFLDALARARLETLVERRAGAARIRVADLLRPLQGKEFTAVSAEDAEKTTALTKRILRHLIAECKTREGQVSAHHIEAVLDLARQARGGKVLQLPGGAEVRGERGTLVFCARADAQASPGAGKTAAGNYEYTLDLAHGATQVRIPELGCAFRLRVIDWPPKRGETKDTGAVLDRDRLRTPVVLRNSRPGDKLQPVGRRNVHKLKRLLGEKHVSRWERDGWPVLTSGGILAWARGFPVAAEFAANERTRAGVVIAEESLS